MELKIKKVDWLFLFLCLIVGIIAEEAFFRDEIGVSYIVFIAVFYSIFFYRFRSFSFSHQRFGYLILISIWLLAISYYLYDSILFYTLNILIIPSLVIFHLALITAPKKAEWSSLHFIFYIMQRLVDGIRYNVRFTKHISGNFKRSSNEDHYKVWKKILIGIAFSLPVLFIILSLLTSADAQFEKLLGNIPNLISVRSDLVFRIAVILIYTCSFFGFMQILLQKNNYIIKREDTVKPITADGIVTITMLLLLDLVYVLFVAIQFKYFFNGALDESYTYAEYARRGFFELIFVTLINLTVITAIIQFTKSILGLLKRTIRIALTVLVLSSGVILISAFMRLTMYEDAYGFTFTRVLAHSFMIFLMVILAYTFVKIWLEKLSLFHFYFITSLIYYAGINIVNLDSFVIDRNIDRFETTGKIDTNYLSNLSSSGILGLIEIYEQNPNVPGLEKLLKQRKTEREYLKNDAWQSYNLTKNKAYIKLGELDL
ncbi:DUF4153 domain-containing protein [Bacillus sp. FSL K6-3431]|uniref:DUF4153 domain-containing protein n=1 Tax=Bacillus sp. FSL K6-3431 TaxID=2921500 RepID=UPI0030F7FCB6